MCVSVKAVVSTPFSLSHFVAPSAHISSARDLIREDAQAQSRMQKVRNKKGVD